MTYSAITQGESAIQIILIALHNMKCKYSISNKNIYNIQCRIS